MKLAIEFIFTVLCLLTPVSRVLAEDQSPLKVGVITPLSGPIAQMGTAFKKGFDLYLEENPTDKMQFIFEDSRYDGKSSISALHKLHNIDKANLVVVWGNTPGDSCAPVAESQRIPMIALSMNPVAKGRKYIVSLGPPLDKLILKIYEKMMEWKLAKPAAVTIDIGNALQSIELLKSKLKDNLLIKVIASEENDFKTIITTLRANKIDGVVLITMPDQALTFLKQSSQLKLNAKIAGGDVFADEKFRQKAADYIPDLSFVYGAVEEEFIAKLKLKYNDTSYFFESAAGYSLAKMLHDVSKSSGWNTDILNVFKSVNTAQVPIQGLRLEHNAEYGSHFECDGKVY